MSDTGSGERPKVKENITVDRALQTVGGIVLFICLGMSSWTLLKVVDHDGEIKVQGVEIKNINTNAAESKRDIAEKLTDIKRSIEKVADKIGATK